MDYVESVTTSPTIFLLVSTTVLFSVYALLHTYFRRLPSNAPKAVSGNFPLIGAIGFWTRRWDFFRHARDHSSTGNFSFHAGPNAVVALSGDTGRQLFFESKELGLGEGYAVLFGQSPKVQDDGTGQQEEYANHFQRRLSQLLKNSEFKKKFPVLISDVQKGLDKIKNEPSALINPFESIYRIVFKLTIRMVGADEIAEDPKLLERTLELFEMIDQSATAAAVMFPKFPSPAVIKRTYAGAQIYMMMQDIVKQRQASGKKHDDALQYLIDQGDRLFKIIEFLVGSLFAGLLNSGINAAWVLCYLASDKYWHSQALEEVRTVAAKYASSPSAPLRDQLDDVPLEAWESEFPVVDMCLRDSIRLNVLGTAFRKNISGKSIPTGNGDEAIPPNAFVTYAIADLHQDPTVYKDPEKWDPSRYLPDRAEDKKKVHGFLGWGVARHPCLGMRFAKLEQNIITAYFLATFNAELTDKDGNVLHEAPKIDFNGHAASKPNPPIFLRTKPREK